MLRAFVRPLVSTTFIRSYMSDSARGPVASGIAEKLRDAFAPSHLEVMNESSGHNVPPGSETHFKVVVVSDVWDGLKLIQRHRKVNATLAHELASGVHALSIVAKTPSEWTEQGGSFDPSPKCLGGFHR